MRNQKSIIPGIASVGFITQFGGGFASGIQIQEYFVSYGVWAFIMPIIAQAIIAICMGYGLKIAYRRRTYNYREFSEQMYGKYGKANMILTNLYEVVYVLLVCLASAVAFEMGAEALYQTTGISKGLCVLLVFVCMTLFTTFGNGFLRQYSIVITVVVAVGVIGVFAVVMADVVTQVGTSIESMFSAQALPISEIEKSVSSVTYDNYKPGISGAVNAFMGAFIYAMLQIASVGLMYQHVNSVKSEKDITKSMWLMFVINLVITEIMVVAMFIVSCMENPTNKAIPIMNLVVGKENIYGKIILVIIFVAALTTATNMISGAVERYVWMIQRKCASVTGSVYKYYIMVAVAFVFISFIVSKIGISEIIKKGYKYIGFGAFITLFIPFVMYMVYHYVVGEKAALKEDWDI